MPHIDALTDDQIIDFSWYYQVELRRGVFTKSLKPITLSMIRDVVARTGIAQQRCLDLGAQEGVMSALMARQGASHVVAYDRMNLSDRVALLKSAHEVAFDYHHSVGMDQLSARLHAAGESRFDVVVFTGVLYHMVDPLNGLARMRNLVRDGGIVILETSAIVLEDRVLQFNAAGRYYPGGCYFQISLAALDYFVRMLRLRPLDMVFTAPNGQNITRVCLVCRAVRDPIPDDGDAWMSGASIERDLYTLGDCLPPTQAPQDDVDYDPVNPSLVCRADTGCVDVLATFRASDPHTIDTEKLCFRLDDIH